MLKVHNNGINKNLIANCTTAADQQIKVATLTDSIGSGWLQPGVIVFVKFTNTNTYSSTAANPCKLNVNNTGAKNIYYENSATPTGTNTIAFGIANYIHQYVYDGTNWVQVGYSKEQGDGTYESKEASSGGTDLSLVTTGEKYTWNSKANGDHNHDSRYYTESETDTKISDAVNALDVSDTAVDGSYIKAVSETDGKISVTREAADTTPTANSKKMVTSGGVKSALDGKANSSHTHDDRYYTETEVDEKLSKTEDLIAYVQTTLTASKSYAVGKQFVYNGLLYKATAAIAQGETITIGGNCTLADSVTEQIKFLRDDISGICKVKKETIHWDSVVAGTVYTVAYLDNIIPRGSLRGVVIINCAGYSAYDVNGELYYVETDAIQYGGTVYYKPSISQNDVTLNCSILYSD